MKALIAYVATAIAALAAFGSCSETVAGETPVVYSAKMTLYPGDVITDDMLSTRPLTQVSGAAAYVMDRDQVVGKVAKHTLLPGQPIAKTALREPYAILQGKVASVSFQSGGLTITGVAVTLEPGAVGDMISARNQESGFVIRGQVQSDGSLRVDAP